MKAGELFLELDVIARRTGDVARAARTRAERVDRFLHGGDHVRVLAHAEIVVRAPDDHILLATVGMADGSLREFAAIAFDVDEDAVAAFGPDVLKRVLESSKVFHRRRFSGAGAVGRASL